jgi:hypothetical protein
MAVCDGDGWASIYSTMETVKMRNLNCRENTDGKTNTVSPECKIWLDPRTTTELRESSLSEEYSSAIGCIDLYTCREGEWES